MLDQLRTGPAVTVIATCQRHGRITTADTPDDLRDVRVDVDPVDVG